MYRPLTRTQVPGIYRRGDAYVVVLRDGSGRQFKRFADTLAEARRLRSGLQADIDRNELTDSRRLTLGEYLGEWQFTYRGRTARGLRQATLDDYVRILRREVLPVMGGVQLADIRISHLKRLAAGLASRGLTNGTIRGTIAPLRALLASAVEDDLIRHNPAAGFRNVYGTRCDRDASTKSLTEEQLVRVLDSAQPWMRELLEFLAETGLRIGEARELRWRDVDFDAGRIHVERAVSRGVVGAPKSRYGVRVIPLTPDRAARLRERCGAPDELIFTNKNGERVDSSNLQNRVFRPAAIKSGVPWATVHTLRHTCASRLFRAGWNAKQVQMLLGHHSPAFTLATYVHLMPGDLPAPIAAPGTIDSRHDVQGLPGVLGG